jgi:ABC-2 type transport system ATP-binding protein
MDPEEAPRSINSPSTANEKKEAVMMAEEVVRVQNFRKTYDKFIAVDDISFEIYRGEIFGLLGPNGAGKTSTLESLEGLRQPDGGNLRILGIDPARQSRRLRSLIGVQLQSSALPGNMTTGEAIQFFCAYHGVKPRFDLLDQFGLADKKKTQFHMLSAGQQRRLALALAVAHNPPVILLDEPTAGLDVPARVELHEMMRQMQKAGTTIILATHDMAEAEKLSDRVAILLKGKIAAAGSPTQLTAAGNGLVKISVASESSSLFKNGGSFPGVRQYVRDDSYGLFFSDDPGPTVSSILDYLKLHQDRLVDLRVERPSLEERFLEITARNN